MPETQTTVCPKCQGAAFGRSQWRSHDEKRRNPGMRPVRCRECGHRFFVEAPANERKSWFVVSGGLAGVAVALMLAVGLWQSPEPVPEAPEGGLSLTITPEAMKAAEAGDADMQFAVASSMLADSELSLAYSTKAIAFLQQAAEHGHARAMLRLGMLYRQGVGAPQNYALAAKWIEMAAGQGEPQALLEMGRLHREGVGMPKDLVKAYVWLNRAAAAREPSAPRERAEVARLLTPQELQKAQDDSMGGHEKSADPAGVAESPQPLSAARKDAR